MTEYYLKNIDGLIIEPTITIDESAKEDIKELMGWDEEEWGFHTHKKLEEPNKSPTKVSKKKTYQIKGTTRVKPK